ncbi:DUF4377 domain-containing protein [Riemerella columbina]|uniref:DUF4377 domain-containing protein n=1 Tax=Riemerella columbina TaxID=103810 RepID=UPI000379D050|nr:DUF4377 domain-containing protein [Riemerella columbina]
MKFIKYFGLLLGLSFLIFACSERGNELVSQNYELKIMAKTTTKKCCVSAPPSEQIDREAMIAQKKGSTATFTLFLDEIKSFTYKKGYEYQITVNEKHQITPSKDDNSIEYTLMKILSDVKKN